MLSVVTPRAGARVVNWREEVSKDGIGLCNPSSLNSSVLEDDMVI